MVLGRPSEGRRRKSKTQMAKRSVTASRERIIHTHAELWHASRVVLRSGQQTPKDSAWQFLASAIFTAFAFEAYLNHVGPKVYARWDDVERLSPLAKLDLICHFLNVSITQGAELSAIKELFDFRMGARGPFATRKSCGPKTSILISVICPATVGRNSSKIRDLPSASESTSKLWQAE